MIDGVLCLISLRNLGDAAVHGGWLARAAQRGLAKEYIVWTKPESAALFGNIPGCEVLTSRAPLGTNRRFSFTDLVHAGRIAATVRRRRPRATLDLVGDFRERLLARLVGAPEHIHVGWANGHPFGRIIRNPISNGSPAWVVPADVINVYAALSLFLDRLCPARPPSIVSPLTVPAVEDSSMGPPRVGLHPLASQVCKLWPEDQWERLAESLLAIGAEVTAFCAPAEQPLLDALFARLAGRVRIVAGPIDAFIAATRELDLMIGLDSFAVHVAERVGVASITLNGANLPALWATPHGKTVADDGGCRFHPCYNLPKCQGAAEPYACIRSIPVARVQSAALASLDVNRLPT